MDKGGILKRDEVRLLAKQGGSLAGRWGGKHMAGPGVGVTGKRGKPGRGRPDRNEGESKGCGEKN